MSKKSLRIIFMGTPDFAVSALRQIVQHSSHEVVAVYSQPPRPSGRGHKLQPSPVHQYALEQGIDVYTPKSLKKEPEQQEFAALDADVAVVAAYGLILPQTILDTPKYGCLNIHASLLPRWRGAAPIHRAILEGDKTSGITIMQMEAGLDTGPMISKIAIPIHPRMVSQELHDNLSMIGGEMIVDVLGVLVKKGVLEAQPQDAALSTYAKMLKKEEGKIDWSQTAEAIDRQIRALNPWPATYTYISTNNKMLKIVEAMPQAISSDQMHNMSIGTLIDKQGHIVCGDETVLKLISVKPENSKTMDLVSALNGGYLEVGGTFI